MKIIFKQLILFSFFVLAVSQPGLSQKPNLHPKGATPLISHNSSPDSYRDIISSTARVVIVGISDYQSPEIPDLKFADKVQKTN